MGDVDPTERINLKLAEFLSNMLLWIWPIGMVALGLGRGTPKGGVIGIIGYLPRTEVSGRSIVTTPSEIIPYYRLNHSIGSLSDNKESSR
jgi:hypothetical protein